MDSDGSKILTASTSQDNSCNEDSSENQNRGIQFGENNPTNDVDDNCMLCDNALDPSKSCVVKERGIKSLINASLRRKDKKNIKLQGLREIIVHRVCQAMYLRETNIKIAEKAAISKISASRKRKKDGRAFNFSANCFFCSNNLFDDREIKRVSQQNTIDNIIAQLTVYPKTETNLSISSRIDALRHCDDKYYTKENISYHAKCLAKFYKYSSTNCKGRPISDSMSNVTSFIINVLLENDDECQFSLKSILAKYTAINGPTDFPRLDRIEQSLKQHFDDEIVIHSTRNDKLICFRQTLGKCIEDRWYSNREKDEKHERLRIVSLAAHLILQDIRSMKFDTNNYKSPTNFFNDVAQDIPETLKLFLDIITKTHKVTPTNNSWAKWDNKVITAAHILMSSARPRSFLSPILLALSTMIHTKFAAKGLIDCLYNIGLCASYAETVRFETSIVNDPQNFDLISDPYLQFVYDNADHNTATIDGKNTFHCMGGIMCVSPSSSVQSNSTIPRIEGALRANTSSTFGFIPLTDFQNNKPFNLNSITVQDLNSLNPIVKTIRINAIDLIWFFGRHTAAETTPNWHGFMNKYHALNNDFKTTKVIPLPFTDAPPTNYTTILTVLIDARVRADKNKQKHCFVTFDLPLFLKASEIIASIDSDNDPHNLRSVIVLLGGFHLLMSFLGSIGYIMEGSGLKEAFSTIYVELSADKALTGHAYSRAVRGHLLVQASLAGVIFQKIELSDHERTFLNESLPQVGQIEFENNLQSATMKEIEAKFSSCVRNLQDNGPTSQLWLQYFEMVCLVQRFLDAERSGNFELHLEIIQLMIPIFYAAGRHLYAKCSLLYLQQMHQLKTIMDIVEYDKYCRQGFFTIRRSNRFWSGVWSDMTIEQVLMRAMKCSGGLTHGRGLTENVIGKWVLSRVAVTEVCNDIEIFCNVTFSTSEQHVDNRCSRVARDANDSLKLKQYFDTHNPFPETDKIMAINSGMIGDTSVNCFKAFAVGQDLMQNVSGQKFSSLKFKRSSKVVNLRAGSSTIKNIDNKEISISPLLIFQRISLNIADKDDMREYITYELAPMPLALFDANGMRKTTKSVFYCNFDSVYDIESTGIIVHMVDGGFLLHKVVWHANENMNDILAKYVAYTIKHYQPNSCVIFDGYPEDETLTTKSVERSRRKMHNFGREILFDKNTNIIVNQKQFLSNEKNKSRLIEMLCDALHAVGFRTKIAFEDADRLIVSTAIENAQMDSNATVVIVGEDVDLLVMFSQLAGDLSNIYFRKEGKGSKPNEYYNGKSFKYQNLQCIVAFLHIFCGCDTTSCFYKKGKNKLIDAFPKPKLIELASIFYQKDATCEEIAGNASQLICGMYSNKAEKALIEKSSSFSLNDLRYLHFSKAKIKSKFTFETLPPTEGAARQHAFRSFYQLQLWLGNTNLKATDWGWKIINNYLTPVGSTDPPMPKKLLQQISCSCSKKGCKDASCGCRKHGLRCTNLCVHCQEDTCFNFEESVIRAESDDDDAYEEHDFGKKAVPMIATEQDDSFNLEVRPAKERKLV